MKTEKEIRKNIARLERMLKTPKDKIPVYNGFLRGEIYSLEWVIKMGRKLTEKGGMVKKNGKNYDWKRI